MRTARPKKKGKGTILSHTQLVLRLRLLIPYSRDSLLTASLTSKGEGIKWILKYKHGLIEEAKMRLWRERKKDELSSTDWLVRVMN